MYGPCITMTAGTPATSAPNMAAEGIMVSTTATSAGSRRSSSATSRQNSRAGPHSCRSLTRRHWLSGLRVCQSLTRSVSGLRHVVIRGVLVPQECRASRFEPGPQPFGAQHPHPWPRATARPTTV